MIDIIDGVIQVDCRKCGNLGDDGCKKYGKDADIAVEKCMDDWFKNYKQTLKS